MTRRGKVCNSTMAPTERPTEVDEKLTAFVEMCTVGRRADHDMLTEC